ncbi:MAG: methyltransferase domain-containing protein [Planctomycetota bacterium]
MSTTVDDATVRQKLPREEEHLDALSRMRALETYYQWTLSLVRPWLGKRVLDAGCGTGNFLESVKTHVDLAHGVDLSPQNLVACRERFANDGNVSVAQADLDADAAELNAMQFDTVVSLDVVEHIEDDVAMLQNLLDVVQPGGHLLLKTPAHKWLFGAVDEASEHYRRYAAGELRDKAQQAGWEIVKLRFMNLSGVGPYFLKSRVLKKKANFSRTFKPWQLKAIRVAVPVFKAVDGVSSLVTGFNGPPAGQSVVLIARKPQ